MPSSRESSAGLEEFNVIPLTATLNERVDWAFKHKTICLYEDQEEVKALVMPIDKTFDRDIVTMLQKKYEEDYKVKKGELVRKRIAEKSQQKEEEKRKDKTNEEWLQEFKKRFPDLFIDKPTTVEVVNGNPAPKPISKRAHEPEDEDENDVEEIELIGAPPKKIVRLRKRAVGDDAGPSRPELGAVREPPCETCRRKDKLCHDQVGISVDDPVCYECRKGKIACPDRVTKMAEKEVAKKTARVVEAKTKPKPRSMRAAPRRKAAPLWFEGASDDGDNIEVLTRALVTLGDKIETGLTAVAQQMKLQTERHNTIATDVRQILDLEREKVGQDPKNMKLKGVPPSNHLLSPSRLYGSGSQDSLLGVRVKKN